MKMWIEYVPDLEEETGDIRMIFDFQNGQPKLDVIISRTYTDEWQEAKDFGREVANTLGLEFHDNAMAYGDDIDHEYVNRGWEYHDEEMRDYLYPSYKETEGYPV